MRRALLLALACACDTPGRDVPGPRVDFNIGGISLHASSGVVVTASGQLTFYLSDQPDTCLSLRFVPVGTATTFSLKIAPPADGTTQATIVAPRPAPAGGQATGTLVRATGGKQDASVDAANGSVAWTANADGSVVLTSIDVGFAGTTDRLTTAGLTLTACKP
ncbi:MAG: hypothetical protein ABR567_01795 [Myxococcales bacterium]|nr:hypothetical protein [Myxococcales bacterium]